MYLSQGANEWYNLPKQDREKMCFNKEGSGQYFNDEVKDAPM